MHTLTPTFTTQTAWTNPSDTAAPWPRPPQWIDTEHAEPCLPGLGPLTIRECSVNIGVSARAVARNIFLDGTWISDSPHVHHEPAYYDLKWGIRLRWTGLMLDYEFTRRSREFSPVPLTGAYRDGHHNYGSLTDRCYDQQAVWCPLAVGALIVAMAFQ